MVWGNGKLYKVCNVGSNSRHKKSLIIIFEKQILVLVVLLEERKSSRCIIIRASEVLLKHVLKCSIGPGTTGIGIFPEAGVVKNPILLGMGIGHYRNLAEIRGLWAGIFNQPDF